MIKQLAIIGLSVLALPLFAQTPVALLPAQPSDSQLDKTAKNAVVAQFAPNAKQGTPAYQVQQSTQISAQGVKQTDNWLGYEAVEKLAVQGNPLQALQQLDMRLVQAPEDSRAAYMKGLILMQTGQVAQAKRWFVMMQANYPELSQPYTALAVIYDGSGEYEKGVAILQQLLTLQPQHVKARQSLAQLYLKLAAQQLGQTLKSAEEDAMILRQLETLIAQLNKAP